MQMQFVNRSAVRQSFTRAATQPRTRWSLNQLTMRRVPPMFPPSIWSVHSATVDSDPRTNNVCEGWNNKFFTLVGSAHPSIWTCIQWFQREHATVTPNQQRINQKQVLLQKRLQNLCNDRISSRKTVAQFLHGIAFNIRLSRHVPIWTSPLKLMNLMLYIRQWNNFQWLYVMDIGKYYPIMHTCISVYILWLSVLPTYRTWI